MNRAEYARHAGVNPGTITRWVQSGRIQAEPDGSIDPEKADRMRRATESPLPHHQARKEQIDAQKAAQALPAMPGMTGPEMSMDNLGTAYKYETYRLQKAKAETANVELDKIAGLLVDRAEVDFVLADFGNTLRGVLDSLPDRLTGELSAHRGDSAAIHKTLADASREILTEISHHMARRISTL